MKIKRFCISIVLIVALLVLSVPTMGYTYTSDDFQVLVHDDCCDFELSIQALVDIEPQIVFSIRIYREDHFFGENEALDLAFDRANNFIEVFKIVLAPNRVLTEVWPDSVLLGRSFCDFMSHVGPIHVTSSGSQTMHSGGGASTWTGVWCIAQSYTAGMCLACGVTSVEVWNQSFLCHSC